MSSPGLGHTTKKDKSIVHSTATTTASSKNQTEVKAKSTVTELKNQTKICSYDPQTVEDAYVPSVQSTQLLKQDEIASVSYCSRLLNTMKENGIICQPVHNGNETVLQVQESQSKVIICTGLPEQDKSSGTCQCDKYFPPQFQMLGSSCHFCYHSILLHRVKPELEKIVFDDTKTESEQNEYKYWFDKFIELQRLYCYTDKNLPFDDNLFIKIYDQSCQASLSFIQSPNYRYVLIKYKYAGVYDEGESLYKTTHRIISLETMLPVKVDEDLNHSWSYFRNGVQMKHGFRTVVWDLNKSATLIATYVKNLDVINDRSYPSFIKKIVNIECPDINDNS
ncbi:unnamed protein product [Adineta steineri]|uniref:Uncharacterized protein n=1 Tax=Adineta steineri TaxID=433720 RepID=A0A819Q300_9BILA|nr:unnamed protein product [Adineta steineri]CAF4022220.1 unnamed protein product [Adineta steineri]